MAKVKCSPWRRSTRRRSCSSTKNGPYATRGRWGCRSCAPSACCYRPKRATSCPRSNRPWMRCGARGAGWGIESISKPSSMREKHHKPTVSPHFDLGYIPQPIVITIASKQHPVSTGQCEEAKRCTPCGHSGERKSCALVSSPPTSSITWWSVWTSSSCPLNTCWRPLPANATCPSPSRACCPTCRGSMPRTLRRSSRSSARSSKTASALGDRVVGQVAERLGEPEGIIAFDPSSFPKRGTQAVGVKRQWCSHRGKVDNCQVGVFMGYVSHDDHALLDFRLSLPEEWAREEQRREE